MRSLFACRLSAFFLPLGLALTACGGGGGGGGGGTPTLRNTVSGTWSLTQRITSVQGPAPVQVGSEDTSIAVFQQTGNALVVDPGVDQLTATISGLSARLASDTTTAGVREVVDATITFNVDGTTLTGSGSTTVTAAGQTTQIVRYTITGAKQAGSATSQFVSGITSPGLAAGASQRAGSLPPAGTGPSANVSGQSTVLNGGTSLVNVSSGPADGGAEFDTILIGIEGAAGFFELELPAPVAVLSLVLQLGNAIPGTTFNCIFQLGANGQFGSRFSKTFGVNASGGTGALQLSLSWDSSADLDLYLVEPNEFTIYYGQTTSTSGGELDVDGNAGCNNSGTNENITYASNPPAGQYEARVNLFSKCNSQATTWVLRRNRNGVTQLVSNGSYSAQTQATPGGATAGQVVQVFDL
jgi:hypothetical protein